MGWRQGQAARCRSAAATFSLPAAAAAAVAPVMGDWLIDNFRSFIITQCSKQQRDVKMSSALT